MTYEIALQTSGPYDQLLGAARWAESNGYTACAIPDHYLLALDATAPVPAYDAFAQLAALARDTVSIELSVLVSPITFRHPAVLAKSALTIDELSGGRFTLGIGTGWLEREHQLFGLAFPDLSTRFEMLEEALGYVTAVLDDAHPGFDGSHYSLEATATWPRPQRVRIVVGGTGASTTPTLAGRFADEYNCYPAPPNDFARRVDVARAAAASAGRDPDELMISSSGAVVAAPTTAEYEALMVERAATAGITRSQLEDHLNRRSTPRGTYTEVREQLDAMAACGMSRFYLQRQADFDRTADLELVEALAG